MLNISFFVPVLIYETKTENIINTGKMEQFEILPKMIYCLIRLL